MSDEEKDAIEEKYNSILNNAKANWIYEDYEILLNFQDLYKQQHKEIEELKEKNENLLDALNNSIDIRKYWVSKDKIKAKIEEWDDKDLTICYGGRSQGRTFQQAVRIEVKKILQSLLEKE